MGSCGFRYGCPKYHHHCLFSRVGSKLPHLMLTFAHSDDSYHTRYTDKEWNEYSQPWEGDAANIYRCVRVCGCAGVRMCGCASYLKKKEKRRRKKNDS